MILEGETVCPDDYPVYWGYCYVACGDQYPEDGEVVIAEFDEIVTTVGWFKRYIGAREIRRCEIVKRERIREEQDRYAANR